MYSVVFLIFCYCSTTVTSLTEDCVQPPLKCPNENVTFWLYTKSNENEPHQVSVSDPESIANAPWVKDGAVKILIHGYTGHKDFAPNTEIRPAYLSCCNYNIISVDYNPIAREPCYFEAARNTELVGMCTAQLIDKLVSTYEFALEQFHVIGFSLGGQTAGFIGNYVTSGKLHRITALDPAMPLFVTTDLDKKIDKTDALFVDVMHTNSLEKGKLEASGHLDIFVNGGVIQTGCKTSQEQSMSGCSHARAPAYYAESITTEIGFYASKCFSWIIYMIGWCDMHQTGEEILIGEYVSRDASGLYFMNTNGEPPYARGPSDKNKNRKRNVHFPWIK